MKGGVKDLPEYSDIQTVNGNGQVSSVDSQTLTVNVFK